MKIILDADGVLLNYNEHMAYICEKALNMKLMKVKEAHHFKNAYNLVLTPEQKTKVYALFDVEGWDRMPQMQGAVEATQLLHKQGHELSCLSSMPAHFVKARKENFKKLNIPIDNVIGSGRDDSGENPKASILNELMPHIFVDDQLRNFEQVDNKICKVWINHQFDDCPNQGKDRALADFEFSCLKEFVEEFIQNPSIFNKNNFKSKP